MKKGMALMEVVVSIIILSILALISLHVISSVMQRSKVVRVVSAKAQIAQLALLLESVRDDTSLYPAFLLDITFASPPKMQEKGWDGFYSATVPLDPWGSPYFYQIPPTTLFTSPPIPRTTGKPDTYTTSFETNPGKAIIRVENYGVTACDITLNGVVVVFEYEFKKKPLPQIIEKEITLLEGNNLVTWARSQPGEFLIVNISASNVPTDKYFILGSYRKDKKEGGKSFAEDITWRSDKYPNYQ